MTCRLCGGIREMKLKAARGHAKAATVGRWVIDAATRTGTYICKSCSSAANLSDYHARQRRHLGRAVAAQQIAAPAARFRVEQPDAYAARQARAIAASVAARRGKPLVLTDRQWLLRRLGAFELDPIGRFGLCSLCDRLVWTRADQVETAPNRCHGPCLWAWLRENAKVRGTPPPPARRRGGGDSDAELRSLYVTTVRYFRITYGHPRRVSNRKADRDEHGQLMSVGGLAKALGIERQQVHWRVNRFLRLLPDESTANGPLKTWRAVFLGLKALSGATPGTI
jgi:hypothetical protein